MSYIFLPQRILALFSEKELADKIKKYNKSNTGNFSIHGIHYFNHDIDRLITKELEFIKYKRDSEELLKLKDSLSNIKTTLDKV